MAKRESLREFQSHLALRMQSARTQGMSASWLAVRAGSGNYLFPLTQPGEIFPLVAMARVPYAVPWFMGVVNLRGGLFGVVDLAHFLGEVRAHGWGESDVSDAQLVTFGAELELNCAVLVDGLAGLRKANAFTSVEPAPQGSPAYFGNRFLDSQGGPWQEINLRLLSQTPEFLSIRA